MPRGTCHNLGAPLPPPTPSPTIVIDAPIISAIAFVIVITYSTTTIVTMSVTSAVATGGSSPRTPKVPLVSPARHNDEGFCGARPCDHHGAGPGLRALQARRT